jgi:hypothetical protein
MKYNFPAIALIPTGVATPWPLRRKLVSKTVWELPEWVRRVSICLRVVWLFMSGLLPFKM